MQLGDTLRLAFASLSARKLRTLLTLLGLIIGVTSLILVMTLIQGANGYVEARIANLGTDIFQVSKVPLATTDFQEILKARKHRDLTFDDWRALERSEEHTSELQSRSDLVCRLLLEKKKQQSY